MAKAAKALVLSMILAVAAADSCGSYPEPSSGGHWCSGYKQDSITCCWGWCDGGCWSDYYNPGGRHTQDGCALSSAPLCEQGHPSKNATEAPALPKNSSPPYSPPSRGNLTGFVPSGSGMLRNPNCGKCVNANYDGASGNQAILYDCDDTDDNNIWTFGTDGTIKNTGCGRCLNVAGDSGDDNTWIIMYDCYDSHTGEPPSDNLWDFNSDDKTIRSRDFDKCLNIAGWNVCDNSAGLIQYSCYDPATGKPTVNSLWEWVPVYTGAKSSVVV